MPISPADGLPDGAAAAIVRPFDSNAAATVLGAESKPEELNVTFSLGMKEQQRMVRVDDNAQATVCGSEGSEFVEVLFARTRDEADGWRRALESRSIPSQIENLPQLPAPCGVAVLVPGGQLVDASEVLVRMAHDEDEDDFEIEDDDDDAEFEDEDDVDLDDDDSDSEFEDDDEEFDEDEDDL